MQKLLNKHQIQVIMVLNAVLLVLFCGVIYTAYATGGSIPSGGTGDVPPPHNIIRAARVSANENIDWEINLGGSKDERIVAAYYAYNRFYIFGNTASTDLDFAGGTGGGFAAVVTSAGNTKAFVTFPYTIVKAITANNGFALLVKTDEKTAALKLLNSDCAEIGSVSTNAAKSPQTAVDLKIYDEHYFVVGSYHNQTQNKDNLVVTVFSSTLTLTCERSFNQAYTHTYVNLLPYGSRFLLAANVVANMPNEKSFLLLADFDYISEPNFKSINKLGFDYTVRGIEPYQKGFVALIDKAGKPELLLINNLLNETSSKYINLAVCEESKLFFMNGNFYVYLKLSSNESKLFTYNTLFDTDGEEVAEGTDLKSLFYTSSGDRGTYLLGASADKLKLIGRSKVDGSTKQLRFASVSETNGRLIPLTDGILVVSESHAKSADVGGNFGGTDVWLSKIVL